MSKNTPTPNSVSQKLSTTPPAAHPANQPAASSNKSGRRFKRGPLLWCFNLVVAGTELEDDDPFILYWYCLLWLSIPKCTIFLNLSQGSSPTNSSSLTLLDPFWWHYNHIVSSRRVITSHSLRFIRWSPHHFKSNRNRRGRSDVTRPFVGH